MKKYIISLVFLLFCMESRAQMAIQAPVKRHASAVAIIIDQETYQQVEKEVLAYRDMLETKENLSAYIVSSQWQKPEEVQAVIKKIAGQNIPLEGTVLIGKIPVALIRKAQHLATAFKMDEVAYPFEESSIASDRFYDDFDLSFRFMKQDEKQPLWYYYELKENSSQIIRSDIYSARIMSHEKGVKQYQEIAAFLKKAVEARNERNPLDKLLSFAGHGYVSESLTAWVDDRSLLNEIFPKAFVKPSNNRFLNHRMENNIKFTLFSELQRPGLDLALISTHGDTDKQYINGNEVATGFRSSYENVRFSLRNTLRDGVAKGKKKEDILKDYTTKYGVPEAWFEGILGNDSLQRVDSVRLANVDIVPSEIVDLSPQTRLLLLDACYNGSFHQAGNVAGAYLFSKGNTLAVNGNSVSVLQDKWLLEHAGLLDSGVRIGNWNKLINTLESHLIGDPTYHFASGESRVDVNKLLIPGRTSAEKWAGLLKEKNPGLQSLALTMLAESHYPEMNEILLNSFLSSPYRSVRMQCLILLSRADSEQYKTALEMAMHDEYELVRRKAATWMGYSGDNRFISTLVAAAISQPNDDRVMFNLNMSLSLMDWDKISEIIKEQVGTDNHFFNKEEKLQTWLHKIKGNKAFAESYFKHVKNKEDKTEKRIQNARIYRNYYYHTFVPELVAMAEDQSEDVLFRKGLLEALGWFSISYKKSEIMAACTRIINDKTNDEAVVLEASQTLLRLQQWRLP
ncbi:HEAT repeat domain-containing protein [Dyadobacter sp. LHD-138]|uniref:HEAT repeat domain-containing protein n=1 Tax=Dyadobacter sp. LHD-138 TaxID=3071413 RepID=UPI0027DFF715|nr:HEAT repeat domain-containing protein [Dyadobacter sp. LHD-138]MDQ6481843.1 HEAT repeat domain-containing protein [Dyadobacter sp. LHD-138]